MNSLFTLRTALILFFIIICQFSLKAQNTATIVIPDKQDTVHLILVITPGKNGSKTTLTLSTEQNGCKTVNSPVPGIAVHTAPVAAIRTIPAGYSAPTTSERPGAITYMSRPALIITPTPTAGNSIHGTSERSGAATYMAPGTPAKTAVTMYPANPAISTRAILTPGIPVKGAGTSTATLSTPGIPAKNANPSNTSTAIPAKKVTAPLTTAVSPVKKDAAHIKKDAVKKNMAKDTTQHIRGKILFAELGGPGLAITGNYDARFSKNRNGLGYRIGTGYYGTGGNDVFTVPIQLNYLFGKGSNFLELGGGTTFLDSRGNNYGSKTFIFDKVVGFIGTATIGYRYEPKDKEFNFRIGFVPLFSDEGVTPAGGLSVGYTFK